MLKSRIRSFRFSAVISEMRYKKTADPKIAVSCSVKKFLCGAQRLGRGLPTDNQPGCEGNTSNIGRVPHKLGCRIVSGILTKKRLEKLITITFLKAFLIIYYIPVCVNTISKDLQELYVLPVSHKKLPFLVIQLVQFVRVCRDILR